MAKNKGKAGSYTGTRKDLGENYNPKTSRDKTKPAWHG